MKNEKRPVATIRAVGAPLIVTIIGMGKQKSVGIPEGFTHLFVLEPGEQLRVVEAQLEIVK